MLSSAAAAVAVAADTPQQQQEEEPQGWFQFESSDSDLIDFSYRQNHNIIIDNNKTPPLPASAAASGTDSFLCVQLRLHDVVRRYFFEGDTGEAQCEDEPCRRTRTVHYVPYCDSDDEEVEKNLTRLLLDNGVRQDALTDLGPLLTSFARRVTPVKVCDSDTISLRPFVLDVDFVVLEYYNRAGTDLVDRTLYEALAAASEEAAPMEEEEEEQPEVYHNGDTVEHVRFDQRSGMTEKCAVCYDDFREGFEVTQLPCSHVYHDHCILQWFMMSKCSCPICRYELK